MTSCPSVRGYTTSKSSAFSTAGAKYGTQSLVHNHMMAHYQRVDSAKAVIDNKPPASMKRFIRAHTKAVELQKRKDKLTDTRISRLSETAVSEDEFDSDSEKRHMTLPADSLDRQHAVVLQNNQGQRYLNHVKRPMSVGVDVYSDRQGTCSLRTVQYKQNRDVSCLSSLQLYDDGELNESFKFKRSSTPISYKTANNTKLIGSMTPRYKVEMYAEDQELHVIKGSVFDKQVQIGRCSSSKRSQRKSLGSESVLATSGEYQRLKNQEKLISEEQAYLTFVEDVTSDVLSRGIFSDRVLRQVFDTHIERRKHELNEAPIVESMDLDIRMDSGRTSNKRNDRMRELIDELKADINIQDTQLQ